MDTDTPIKEAKPRKGLTAENLERLGADRLAAILLQVAEEQPSTKRRLGSCQTKFVRSRGGVVDGTDGQGERPGLAR